MHQIVNDMFRKNLDIIKERKVLFLVKDVEDKTRQAWKVTMKKLDKLNTPVEQFKDDLARERIDQVLEIK
jgi:hypothetical protein